MTDIQNLTTDQIRRIIAIKEQIESLEQQLAGILGGSVQNGTTAPAAPAPGKRKLSASHRRKLVKALAKARKIRWAKAKANANATGADEAKPAKKRDGRSSPAARAKQSAAAKARWKKVRAEGKTGL